MMRHGVAAFALLGSVVAGAAPAEGRLLFEPHRLSDGRLVLVARDCGRLSEDAERVCEPWETRFSGSGEYRRRDGRTATYRGDDAALNDLLSRQRYAEVWLISGGGSLDAGIRMGRVLRRHRMTVRVPRNFSCVSACTVAFMGGLFRYVDEGATYEVHSASTVSSGMSERLEADAARGEFRDFAEWARVLSRLTAIQLFTHFQNTLIIPTGARPRPENDDNFRRWAQDVPSRGFYTAAQEATDRQRMAAEGVAAAQDIMMRIERTAMDAAIADLRDLIARGQLGPRAEPALRMVEAMYDVSIKETAVLSRETMLRMGYITQDVSGGGTP